MKITHVSAVLITAGLLSACGGGGGAAEPAAPAPAAPVAEAPVTDTPPPVADAPTSVVTTRFLPDETRVTGHLRGRSGVFTFNQAEFTQRDDGAIVKISDTLYDTALSGEAKVKDIHGDADFAMGRWAAGVYSSRSRSPLTFAESGDDSYHYVLVNSPATLPSGGTAICDDGAFTRPTAVRTGVQGERVGPGQASGTANLVFSSEGAGFDVSISASRGNKTGQKQFMGMIGSASQWTLAGGAPGTNALVKLGRAAGDKYLLVGTYAIVQGDGSEFMGAFTFRCSWSAPVEVPVVPIVTIPTDSPPTLVQVD